MEGPDDLGRPVGRHLKANAYLQRAEHKDLGTMTAVANPARCEGNPNHMAEISLGGDCPQISIDELQRIIEQHEAKERLCVPPLGIPQWSM